LTTPAFDAIQVRVARPARNFAAVSAFYGTTLGLPVIASFGDHDGHDGVIFGLPDASRQIEILQADNAVPSPTNEDQLILYFGSPQRVEEVAARFRAAGHEPRIAPNPYWERNGAVCFVDPDGYWLILSPQTW
jgi:catechol 2,3-dioxygenase-like lactoylglutathione lyase family enzyme